MSRVRIPSFALFPLLLHLSFCYGEEMRKKFSLPLFLEGLLLLGLSLMLLLSLLFFHQGEGARHLLGTFGYGVALCLFYLFGLASFCLPLYGIRSAWILMRKKKRQEGPLQWICLGIALFSLSVLLTLFQSLLPSSLLGSWLYSDATRSYLGGVPTYVLYTHPGSFSLHALFGGTGCALLFGLLLFVSTLLLTEWNAERLWPWLKALFRGQKEAAPAPALLPKVVEATLIPPAPLRPTVTLPPPRKQAAPPKHELRTLSSSTYTLPPSSLLTQIKKSDPSSLKSDLLRLAAILEETFQSFGIEAKVGEIRSGPTITSFEVHPAVGVKVQRIKTLENDLALNLQATSIRIIAPIPGKAAVGIEVPNPSPQEVSFREMIETYQGSSKKVTIPLLLGKAVDGEDIVSDLAKMPHCIIAGATGSGKSVCINTLIMSILMNARPDEIKLVMIDPKKVELSGYSRLPHMLSPVITEPEEAYAAFLWLVKEMERRYELFRQLGIRNIHGFNTRTVNRELEASLEGEVPAHLPYIVVIVDELADLMMVASHDIETPIARIAQMARAVGIHMVLATQRPSREVITGLIKANFPTRIAFKVASRVNSQIIMDENGAEGLLGNGDMLFMPPGTSSLLRAQGAYVRDEDIRQVVEFICKQAKTEYLIPCFSALAEEKGGRLGEVESDDPLYEEAKALVFETGNASTTFLQRKLKLGYARAASLMDALERGGVIGPPDGAKPRKIFYPSEPQSD